MTRPEAAGAPDALTGITPSEIALTEALLNLADCWALTSIP
jgi:hypothetical protein